MEDVAVESAVASEIPNKLYFRIGEVASIAGIKTSVVRFWESEFARLGPQKSGTGHRLYRRKDVELVLEIKRLLYDKRFTIPGARKFLEEERRAPHYKLAAPARQTELFSPVPLVVQDVRRGLNEILAILNHSAAKSHTA